LKPQNSDLALWSNKRSARGRSGERGRGGSSSQRRQSPRPNQGMPSNKNESNSCFIVVDLDILLETVIRRRVMRLGINLENIQVIMQNNLQIMISDCLLLVMILMNPRILIHMILDCLCLMLLCLLKLDDVDAWFVDSGASVHMTCNKKWYTNFKETQNGANIYLGDDRAHQIKGYKDILVTLSNGTVHHIHNVVYVPEIKKNLIYVSTITDQNLKVEFFKNYCIVKDMFDQYRMVAMGARAGGLYKLDVTSKEHHALTSATMPT
jgi:hypothetical protein